MDIQDKVVLITGATEGIGLATARLFAERGARLALAARSVDKLEQLAGELPGAIAVPADMRDATAARAMVGRTAEHFGRLDVLINNAGRSLRAPVEQIDLEDYRELIALNLLGPLAAMQAAIPIMRQQGGGMIVNISSGTSKMYLPGIGAYSATKRALNGLSLTARAELAPDNIRVCIMYPNLTATRFGENAMRSRAAAGQAGGRPGIPPRTMPQPDPPEMVAERILAAVRDEVAEQYMGEEQRERLAGLSQA